MHQSHPQQPLAAPHAEFHRLLRLAEIFEENAQIAFYRRLLPPYIRDKISAQLPEPRTMIEWTERARDHQAAWLRNRAIDRAQGDKYKKKKDREATVRAVATGTKLTKEEKEQLFKEAQAAVARAHGAPSSPGPVGGSSSSAAPQAGGSSSSNRTPCLDSHLQIQASLGISSSWLTL